MDDDPRGKPAVLDASADTGGTFTDVVLRRLDGGQIASKVLSSGVARFVLASVDGSSVTLADVDPPLADWSGFQLQSPGHEAVGIVGSTDGGRTLRLERSSGLRPGAVVDLSNGEPAPVLGVRLATGTPMTHPLPDVALRLGTTRGTNALLEGRIDPVLLVVTKGFRDLLTIGNQHRPDIFALPVVLPGTVHAGVLEAIERVDASGTVLVELDEQCLAREADRFIEQGITSAAVAFMHAWRAPGHEERAARVLRDCGFQHVTTSSGLAPVIRIVPRAQAAVVDASLQSPVGGFLESVRSGLGASRDVLVMTSSGGLVASGAYRARDSLLSGPAAGVAGAAGVARRWGFDRAISFDMGGTSTDVSRWDRGFTYQFEQTIGDVTLATEALDITTVAAGGGSICHSIDGELDVGPRSGGADPGPACYGRGGPLCLTDVNLLLGRVDPIRFGVPIDAAAAQHAFDEVTVGMDPDAAMDRLLARANRRMADAVARISLRQGCDPSDFVLVAFGGAGPQHACAVAEALSIRSILVPRGASVLSAVGLMESSIERFEHEEVLEELSCIEDLQERITTLEQRARQRVVDAGGCEESIEVRRVLLDLRLRGQDTTLDVPWKPGMNIEEAFAERFLAMYGYTPPDRPVELASLHVLAGTRPEPITPVPRPEPRLRVASTRSIRARFAGRWIEAPSIAVEDLVVGDLIHGPAILTDRMTTTVLEPEWSALAGPDGALLLERSGTSVSIVPRDADAEVERFADAFTAVAREMGEVLQRCAISVNVKERRDYSCALLDAQGRLVVNAPHLPVHLGSMGSCVQEVIRVIDMQPGDVVLTNHPRYGGSHLPDLTVISPVYHEGGLLGYVASRAHHAELGGSRPGSMPPDASRLVDEGVVVPPLKVIEGGVGHWDEVECLLLSPPWPTRRIEDNLADLRAAVAANHRGVEALRILAASSAPGAVSMNMHRLQARAESLARAALQSLPDGRCEATEVMDDGTRLSVAIEIDGDRATVDFAGTSGVHPGNLNATTAIVRSAVLYVLRLLIGRRLPLNDGILDPVDLVIPEGMLNPPWVEDPSRCPAVVGGNVETSQRLVDTLLKALGRSAGSQGTMNNTLFGNAQFGYYETIAGGCGAVDGTPGASGVHSHMTNTRITDPEILEQRYPVRLEAFQMRAGSGGPGRFSGGEGLHRVLRFLEPVQLSMLTQHRQEGPFGMAGGGPGAPGRQQVTIAGTDAEVLEASDQRDLPAGSLLEIWTPGGGGWGEPVEFSSVPRAGR
ncbi:MAG: hydantoinase B/oxoprolinase family protein [Phycisphaerales bacterium]|nr:hydantoinase B/oxoprolinase family protein [Phycisphaerales bacterium]